MRLVARPIEVWPGELTPDEHRTPTPFKASWSDTVQMLEREVRMLGAEGDVVLQLAITERQCRLDGWMNERAVPSHPGVLLTFDSRHGPLRYSTDEFTNRGWNGYLAGWQSNVRAVALGLESLRRVDRYGIARAGEQYRGYRALPSGELTSEQAVKVLLGYVELDEWPDTDHARRWVYRAALRGSHPDHGGSTDEFMAVQAAGRYLGLASIELGAAT